MVTALVLLLRAERRAASASATTAATARVSHADVTSQED
jgi:hypothetical protein